MTFDAAEIRACWEARGGWVDFTRSELEELVDLILSTNEEKKPCAMKENTP